MPGSGGIPESAGGADWEGTGAGWLASGGMDKSVKVGLPEVILCAVVVLMVFIFRCGT